jgi:hypothetical protein
MVIGQLLVLKRGAAVLTLSPVPDIEILAGKLNDRSFSLNKAIQSNHSGEP